jgi:hypothetical protein
VVDLAPENGDWEGAVAALRKIGFAAWVRNMPGHGYAGSGAHIHAVLIGNKELSPQATTQVNSYLHNDDGLSGSRPDDGPRDFVNNRFVWGKSPKKAAEPDFRDGLIQNAKTFLGTPFKWGGEDYDGVDGVGFVRAVYKKLGAEIPQDLGDLLQSARPESIESAQKGDMVGWTAHPGNSGTHAGVYLGNGLVLEAGGPGRVVQVSALSEAPGAYSIPLNALPSAARPPIQTTQLSGSTSVVEPHAAIPGPKPIKPAKPKAEGIFAGGTTFDQKPKGVQ